MKFYRSSIASEATDEVLLSRFKDSGDLEVLGDLYQRHAEMVYYVCFRYFKESERSKDAVMQIFEELIVKIGKQEIQNFGKWIYVVAKNHCLMALRATKNKIEIPVDNFVEFSALSHPEENYAEKEGRLMQLERCVDKLPERQKQSVDLFFLQEKCYKEVVELTGFSLNEVKSYIQNGKRNLKICLEKVDG